MVTLVIPFFTDQNVPDSVGRYITSAGHDLIRLRDCMATNSRDPVVAAVCVVGKRVLISHDNDFTGIAKRIETTRRTVAHRLHRIHLKCPETNGARRMEELMSLIQHEWEIAQGSVRPMVIEVLDQTVRVMR